jgi:S1-C subfamily serine protease
MYEPQSVRGIDVRVRGPVAAALVVVLAVLVSAPGGAEEPIGERPIPDHALESERNTIEVFRRVADSVVFVTNERIQPGMRGLDATTIPQNTGSGIVWNELGHILTNFHVIQHGNSFSVTLKDGSTHPAEVVGWDPNKDLAVLKIEANPARLAPAERGRSAELIVGQKVLAIGNPFGLDHTLTVGIISALGREMQSIAGTIVEDVIQTDALINPGNSGGPLLDSAGRMIGVNTQIISPSGHSAGIGFAVPVDTVVRIVPQLIEHGRVQRAGFGIRILPDAYPRQWGVRGVVVREVNPKSPAHRAGLRSMQVDRRGTVTGYDLITAVEDDAIRGYNDLYQALDGRKAGEEVTITYVREGESRQATMRLQALE